MLENISWKMRHPARTSLLNLFAMAPDVGTGSYRFMLAFIHSFLECRRQFFVLRCVYSWNAVPDKLVLLDSVDAFKKGLHDVLAPDCLSLWIHCSVDTINIKF